MSANDKKKRYTTYISKRHLDILRELSDETDEPKNRLIGEALDDFFEVLGTLDEPEFIPLDKDHLRRRIKEEKHKQQT